MTEDFSDPDWWLRPEVQAKVYSGVSTSLCELVLEVWDKSACKTRVVPFSGFLLTFRGKCFWATAGHVVHSILAALKDPVFDIKRSRLRDGTSVNNFLTEAIPVALDEDSFFGLDRNREDRPHDNGFDYGFMRLDDLTFACLMSNPKRTNFLAGEDVLASSAGDVVGMYVLGCPNEQVDLSGTSAKYTRACVPARVCVGPPDGFPVRPQALYGTILGPNRDRQWPNDIENMSGGPVIAVERSSQGVVGFRLVGIQSRWWQLSRTIQVSSVKDMLRSIDRVLNPVVV